MNPLISPLKELRGNRTIDAIAHRAHLNRNLVIRAEQGCYTNPPPALLNFYLREIPDPTAIKLKKFLTTLSKDYHQFQTATRQANGPNGLEVLSLDWLVNYLPSLTVSINAASINPITAWRVFSELSKAKVAVSYCIHLDIVQRIENRPHLIPNDLPGQYLTALTEAGYPVGGLNTSYRNFRAEQRKLMKDAS